MNESNEEVRRQVEGWNGAAYLALHQHGDVYKHIVQLLDAALQTDNVFVPGFNLTQSLFRDPSVHNLWTGGGQAQFRQTSTTQEFQGRLVSG